MGLSFYNEASMVETIGSLRFATDNEKPMSERRHSRESLERIDDIEIAAISERQISDITIKV